MCALDYLSPNKNEVSMQNALACRAGFISLIKRIQMFLTY